MFLNGISAFEQVLFVFNHVFKEALLEISQQKSGLFPHLI